MADDETVETRSQRAIDFYCMGAIEYQTAGLFAGQVHRANKVGAKYLTLWLTSPGGYIDSMMSMIDSIRALQADGVVVRCVVRGQAEAEAAWVMLACDERLMSRYGRVSFGGIDMKDEKGTGFGGRSSKLPDWAAWRLAFVEGITQGLMKRAGASFTDDQMKLLFGTGEKAPVDFDAEAALDAGIITGILEVD